MNHWKYTDATNLVVVKLNVDGSNESCLVSAIADWISEGNTVTPADLPIPLTYKELRAAEYPP